MSGICGCHLLRLVHCPCGVVGLKAYPCDRHPHVAILHHFVAGPFDWNGKWCRMIGGMSLVCRRCSSRCPDHLRRLFFKLLIVRASCLRAMCYVGSHCDHSSTKDAYTPVVRLLHPRSPCGSTQPLGAPKRPVIFVFILVRIRVRFKRTPIRHGRS